MQEKTKERISESNRSKIVNRIDDPLIRLQYSDIMDLQKIIDKNWDLFKDRFDSREKLKSHFLALKNYRNPLGHARDMDIVEQKQGEAAVVWFRRTLSAPIGASQSAQPLWRICKEPVNQGCAELVIRVSIRTRVLSGRYWGHSRHWSALGLNGSAAFDPKRSGHCVDAAHASVKGGKRSFKNLGAAIQQLRLILVLSPCQKHLRRHSD